MVDGIFVLNIVSPALITNSSASFAYIVESFDMWHGKLGLGHVNVVLIKKLRNLQI